MISFLIVSALGMLAIWCLFMLLIDPLDGGPVWLIVLALCGILAAVTIPLTGGLLPEFSQGYRDGYLTKLSRSGIIFKTYDGEMQVGTGAISALQEPFRFSVPDSEAREMVIEYAAQGTRVRLFYSQYLIGNLREGATRYIVHKVVPMEPVRGLFPREEEQQYER